MKLFEKHIQNFDVLINELIKIYPKNRYKLIDYNNWQTIFY